MADATTCQQFFAQPRLMAKTFALPPLNCAEQICLCRQFEGSKSVQRSMTNVSAWLCFRGAQTNLDVLCGDVERDVAWLVVR